MSSPTDRLNAVVETIHQRWGQQSLRRGSTSTTVASLPTGNPMLDAAVPGGGLPRGALTLLCGPPTSGRTTLALQLTAQTQAGGEQAIWLDLSHSFDPHAAARWNVSLPDLVLVRPQEATEALEILRDVLDSRATGLVVLSLPLDGWPRDALPLAHALHRLRGALTASQAVCLVLAPPQTAQHVSSVFTLTTQRGQWLVEQGELVGYYVTVQVGQGKTVHFEVPL